MTSDLNPDAASVVTSEYYEVTIESADGTEFQQFAAEPVARRTFANERARLLDGQRLTLTKVILLDAAEGDGTNV
jgi:hypothetical protein